MIVRERSKRFTEVIYHRMKYFLTPQLDLYKNVRREFIGSYGTSVLDYGCGSGVGTMILCHDKNRVVGVDCDKDAIGFARELFGHFCEFAVGDWSTGERYRVEQRTSSTGAISLELFSLVTCIEVIEHVETSDVLLANLAHSVVDDGVVIVSTLNHNSQYRKNEAHMRGYHVDDFEAALAKHFSSVILTDYTLRNKIGTDSTVTPVVAVCRKR